LTGATGLTGPAGATGPQGSIGVTGATGLTGTTGPQGPIGLTGATCATGPQGPIGLTGVTGATGPQGPIGLTGATGPTGSQGLTGLTGSAGAAGATGASGKNTLVKTTTEAAGVNCATGGVKLEYGLDANSNSVLDAGEITASLTKYVCNGAVGAPGATGPQGTIGLTGATGATGPQGQIGLTGATGPQGPIGLTGATGLTGPAGATGLTGATGPQGSIGMTGSAGSNGSNGLNSLVKSTTEAPGSNCATGGVKLEYGLDANNSSVLDVNEINESLTKYVCNGNNSQSSSNSNFITYTTTGAPIQNGTIGQFALNLISGQLYFWNSTVWSLINSQCQAPTPAIAGANQSPLNFEIITLNANTPTVGMGHWKIISGTGGNFGNINSPISTFEGLPNTNYSLAWVISTLCDSSTSVKNVSYLPFIEYNSSASWIVPQGINEVKIEIVGGGGGGAPSGGDCGYYGCYAKQPGGGSGGYGQFSVTTSSGQGIAFTIGSGGLVGQNGESTICLGYSSFGGFSGNNSGTGGSSNCPIIQVGNSGGNGFSGGGCQGNSFNGAPSIFIFGGGGDGGFYTNCGSYTGYQSYGYNGGIRITPLN
jgi:hypothetical protein